MELEWEGNSINDMISDSVVAIIIQAETSPASVKGIFIQLAKLIYYLPLFKKPPNQHTRIRIPILARKSNQSRQSKKLGVGRKHLPRLL